MAPAYANISMGRLEKQLLINVIYQFIDDIYMKWLHDHGNHDTFEIEQSNLISRVLLCKELQFLKYQYLPFLSDYSVCIRSIFCL